MPDPVIILICGGFVLFLIWFSRLERPDWWDK